MIEINFPASVSINNSIPSFFVRLDPTSDPIADPTSPPTREQYLIQSQSQ